MRSVRSILVNKNVEDTAVYDQRWPRRLSVPYLLSQRVVTGSTRVALTP